MDGNRPGRVTRAALRGYYPDKRWYTRVLPLPDHACVFVKNAKVGTSTVLLWLQRIHSGDHAFSPSGASIHFEHTLPSPDEVGRARVARMLGGAAFRFTFVRDPVRRVESAYINKVVEAADGKLGRRVQLQRTLGLPEDRESVPTFEQFVASLEVQDPIRMDPHWRPQHLNLMHPLVEYDAIGRLETFGADLARIGEAIGAPRVPVEAQNVTPRRTASLFDGRPDLLRAVHDTYARDFELYGY